MVLLVEQELLTKEYFDWMTTFTKNLAGTVSIDDEEFRVGLLRYSTDSDVQFHLNGYSSSGDNVKLNSVSFSPFSRSPSIICA
jgi:hypothetical protein